MYIYFFYILVGIIVLISTLIMTRWFKSNRMLNFYLVKISLTLCIFLIFNGLKHLKWIFNIQDFGNFNYNQVILILSPSLYLYFEKLVTDIKYPEFKDIIYFIIPFILFIYFGSEDYFSNIFLSALIYFLFILYTSFYYYKSNQIIRYKLRAYFKSTESNPLYESWVSFIFFMAGIVFIHFYITQVLYFFSIKIFLNSILELSFLVIFVIGYLRVMTTPELFFGSAHLNRISKVKSVTNLKINSIWNLEITSYKLRPREILIFNKVHLNIPDYISQIEEMALVNYVFRNPNYSIINLATDLGLPKYFLEFIFKYYSSISFSEYKKVVRIYDAIGLINNDFLKHNKLETLASKVGFASYNPFLINFKEITGVSPNMYYKNRCISNFTFFQFNPP